MEASGDPAKVRTRCSSPNGSRVGKRAMPEQFVVPQFLDVEDKILGPITARQFVILIVDFIILTILYKLLLFGYFIGVGLFILGAGLVLAFIRVNGHPFHYFLLNIIQTFRRPKIRIWNKALLPGDIKEILRVEVAAPPIPKPVKEKLGATRISELTLVLNTGGAYNPEQYK